MIRFQCRRTTAQRNYQPMTAQLGNVNAALYCFQLKASIERSHRRTVCWCWHAVHTPNVLYLLVLSVVDLDFVSEYVLLYKFLPFYLIALVDLRVEQNDMFIFQHAKQDHKDPDHFRSFKHLTQFVYFYVFITLRVSLLCMLYAPAPIILSKNC